MSKVSAESNSKRPATEMEKESEDEDFFFAYEEDSGDEGALESSKVKGLYRQEDTEVFGRSSIANQERSLGAFLFADKLSSLDNLQEKPQEEETESKDTEETEESQQQSELPPTRKPAWVDDTDKDYEVPENTSHLRVTKDTSIKQKPKRIKLTEVLDAKFTEVYGPTPNWAKLDNKTTEEESEDEFYNPRVIGKMLTSKKREMSTDKIKCRSRGNIHSSPKDKVTAVDFHPTVPMAMIAGARRKKQGIVAFYQVDGDKNLLIEEKLIKNYAVNCGSLLLDGSKFLVGSARHKHAMVFDMKTAKSTNINFYDESNDFTMREFVVCPSGKYVLFYSHRGRMDLFEAKHMSHISSAHVPANVASACFNQDSTEMLCYGDNGVVYTYDMKNFRCSSHFYDEGCVHGTSVTMSPNNRFIACGSQSGIVNVYDRLTIEDQSPKPIKSVGNLLTPISDVKFNSTSEVLAMCSRMEMDSVKLVNMSTMTVYKNFPNLTKPFNREWNSITFSPKSGYMILSSFDGVARLFRLGHYGQY